jgi:hypothetical protein
MSEVAPTTPSGPPAGWYDAQDGSGRQQWYDGTTWTEHYQGAAAAPQLPMQAPVQTDVRKARDKAQYVRQQTGHSITKHLLLGWMVLYIPTIYYAASPNHYFHA